MNQRLKITAILKSNPIINNDLYFDGILYFLTRKKQLGADWFNLQRFGEMEKNCIPKIRLPLVRKNKSYLASKACYKLELEYINHWRKRWNELSANQWCELKRVYLDQKTTKNYNFPVNVKILKNNKIWWYCVGDRAEIERLLAGCYGIGKEIGQGYGLVHEWKVEPTKHKGVRVFPIICEQKLPDDDIISYQTVNPPYALQSKKQKCVYRKF